MVVAAMHGTGTATPQNQKQAAHYYSLAATQGLVHAQFNRAAQPNAFCYTFNTKCAPLATKNKP